MLYHLQASAAEFSRDGRLLVTSGASIEVWLATDGRSSARLPRSGSRDRATFLDDQRVLAWSDSDIQVFETDGTPLTRSLPTNRWAAGGEVLARVTHPSEIQVLDLRDPRRSVSTRTEGSVRLLHATRKGRRVLAVDSGDLMAAFDPHSGKVLWRRRVPNLAWLEPSPDEQWLAVHDGGSAEVLHLDTGAVAARLLQDTKACLARFSADSQILALSPELEFRRDPAGRRESARLACFRVGSWEAFGGIEHGTYDLEVHFSRDSTRRLSALSMIDEDGDGPMETTATLLDLREKRLVKVETQDGWLTALSPDGLVIAVDSRRLGREPQEVVLFRADDGSRLESVPNEGGRFFFHPDSRILAVVDREGLRAWRVPPSSDLERRSRPR